MVVPVRHAGAAACASKGCQEPGVWRPVIAFWASQAKDHLPAECPFGLALCDRHRLETKLRDLVSDKFWVLAERAMTHLGKARPDRSTAELRWIPASDASRDPGTPAFKWPSS